MPKERARFFPELAIEEERALQAEGRERSRDDLFYLTKHVLGYTRLTDIYHKQMAADITSTDHRFKLLLHARGHFKSTIGTEGNAIRKLLRNPNERILIDNVKLGNSRKFLRAIAHHFAANPRFRWLWRDYWIDNYASRYHRAEMGDKLDWVVRDTQDEFTLLRPYEGREASITTAGVDASMVSQHYSTIIGDDLVNRDYVSTMEMVEKSITHIKDLFDLLDPNGEMLLIGTRWAHIDLYDWIIKEFAHKADIRAPKGYLDTAIIRKSKLSGPKTWIISIQPAFNDAGDPVFPEEFTPNVMQDLLQAKGPYEFGAQYLLNPTPKEHQKFREEWLRTIDVLPRPSELEVCITVDPAKSLADEADNTAVAVCGYNDRNEMFLLDGIDEHVDTDEFLNYIFGLIRYWDKHAGLLLPVGFEAVGFQETYVYNLERMMMEQNFFFKIEPIKRRVAAKNERILRLVPRIKNGFFMPKEIVKDPIGKRDPSYDLCQRLKFQLTRFPFAGKDDLADAMADQLEIVKANRLPEEETDDQIRLVRPDFIHRSILEDRRVLRNRQHQIGRATVRVR